MDFIKIHPTDNVSVALTPLARGIQACGVTITEDIPAGHKFAVSRISAGENVIKYGSPIGHAVEDIAVGSWVHTHNTKTNLSDVIDYTYTPSNPTVTAQKPKTCQGSSRDHRYSANIDNSRDISRRKTKIFA